MEIYKITNKLNGKGYVGQTTLTTKKRFLQDQINIMKLLKYLK